MISPLFIAGTPVSPTVNFDSTNGLLQITGRSIPEHPVKFYQPIENWLNEYLSSLPSNIKLSIYLDYMNTHSTECMLILLKRLKEYQASTSKENIEVEWSFDVDDEDMETLGEDLAEISQLPFQYKHVK